MRVVLLGLIVVLVAVSGSLAVRYSQDAAYAQEELNKERYKRIIVEENLQRANLEISSLNAELIRSQKKIENAESALKRTTAINDDLKQRLDKAAQIQMSLDKKIAELQRLASPL